MAGYTSRCTNVLTVQALYPMDRPAKGIDVLKKAYTGELFCDIYGLSGTRPLVLP